MAATARTIPPRSCQPPPIAISKPSVIPTRMIAPALTARLTRSPLAAGARLSRNSITPSGCAGPGSQGAAHEEIESKRQEREEARNEAVRPEVALDVEVRGFRIADDVGVDVELLGELRPHERRDALRRCRPKQRAVLRGPRASDADAGGAGPSSSSLRQCRNRDDLPPERRAVDVQSEQAAEC